MYILRSWYYGLYYCTTKVFLYRAIFSSLYNISTIQYPLTSCGWILPTESYLNQHHTNEAVHLTYYGRMPSVQVLHAWAPPLFFFSLPTFKTITCSWLYTLDALVTPTKIPSYIYETVRSKWNPYSVSTAFKNTEETCIFNATSYQ